MLTCYRNERTALPPGLIRSTLGILQGSRKYHNAFEQVNFFCSCLKLHDLSEARMYWFAVTTYWPLCPVYLSHTREHYPFYLFVTVTHRCESRKIYVCFLYKQPGSFTLKVLAGVYFSIFILEKKSYFLRSLYSEVKFWLVWQFSCMFAHCFKYEVNSL